MEELSSSSSSTSSTAATVRPKRKVKRKRMKKKSPPNFQRCLICLGTSTSSAFSANGDTSEDDDKLGYGGGGGTKLIIPGAEECVQLNKHLEQMFILRKLLELPLNWCEDTLKEHTEKVLSKEKDKQSDKVKVDDEGEEVNGDLNKWFNLCVKCSKKWVQPGWEIYQKIVDLEEQLKLIRGTVRETIKEKILMRKRNRKWSGLTGNGMDVQVRKWMFPDLIVIKAGQEEGEIVKPTARPRPSYKTEPEIITPDDPQDDDFNYDPDPGQDEDYPSPAPSSPGTPPPPSSSKGKSPASKKKRSKSKPSGPPRKRIRIRKPRRKFEDLKKFKCALCSSYFQKYEDLTNHLLFHENSEKYHVCPQCTFPAVTPLDLQFHIKNRHERKKTRRCSWASCEFTCKSLVRLTKHLKEVHQEEEVEAFSCENCGRSFSKREGMLSHQRKMHPEIFGAELEEPVECEECGEKFVSMILLGYHVERKHRLDGLSKFQCEECGKGFNDRSYLNRHMIKHVNETKRDFVCDICGVDYAYKSLLQGHYRKVHGGGGGGGGGGDGGGEVFRCKYCEVTSLYKVVIDRHLREHKEEMGNRCSKCGKFYVNLQGLRRHLKLNHPKEEIRVECPWCRKGFPSREYMRMHERLYCKVKGKGEGGGGGEQASGGGGEEEEVEVDTKVILEEIQ